MGAGDEIMATGEARRLQLGDDRPICIVGRDGRPRWHELWDGNPRLVRRPEGARILVNGPGCRPYIDHERSTRERWVWADWRVTPGELHLTPTERSLGQPVVIVEPHLKPGASVNKQWGWERWQDLVLAAPRLPWAQMGRPGTRWLRGVRPIPTMSFRHACGVLSGAIAAVLPEGGLHHAAAALGVQAVVLFGGYMSPSVTGYALHRNLWVDDPGALGWRIAHAACARTWERIPPTLVLETLMEFIMRTDTSGPAAPAAGPASGRSR